MSGIVRLAAGIEAELARRSPRQRKTQRGKLALLVATMLSERSANLMDLAAAVPRPAERTDMRYQWIARLLANPRLDGDAVMQPFAEAAILHAGAAGGTVVLILDQSKVSARHQVLMLSVRVGERALPLAWRVRETRGGIGFIEQQELLTVVAGWLPAGTRIALMGDRFHGSPDLIALCRKLGWGWRLRLKQELLVFEGGGEATLAACFAGGQHLLSGIELTGKRVVTDVAMVHEPGHPEPWIVALSGAADRPPRPRLRAQVGHRGDVFRLQDQRLRAGGQPAPSPGAARAPALGDGAGPALGGVHRHVGDRAPPPARRKKAPGRRPRKVARGRTSLFRRGLRRIKRLLQFLVPLPPLWSVWQN